LIVGRRTWAKDGRVPVLHLGAGTGTGTTIVLPVEVAGYLHGAMDFEGCSSLGGLRT
jgi:hypothetical protein